VAYFTDEQDVYRYLGQLFVELLADDELAPKFIEANTVVRYEYAKPTAQITVKLLSGEDGQVDLGPSDLEPEVVLAMDADVAHRFWLGKVNVAMAMARGQIKTQGPVAKILKLAPLVKPAQSHYRAILEAAGRSDLLNV
jgi:SCP-2 sterol transfer family